MTAVVYETCACGAAVPRRVSPNAVEVVFCPECGIEVRDCKAPGCDQKAIGYSGTFDRPLFLCSLHAALLEFAGGRPVRRWPTYVKESSEYQPVEKEDRS